MQGERKTKRKRSFQDLFFRAAAYLARSESSANREQKQVKQSLKFAFAEMQPILREAKVVARRAKNKAKTKFSRFAFAEMQPILREAKVVAR